MKYQSLSSLEYYSLETSQVLIINEEIERFITFSSIGILIDLWRELRIMPITDVDSIIAECQRSAGQFTMGFLIVLGEGSKTTHGNDNDDDLL